MFINIFSYCKTYDVKGVDIEMRRPDYWMARVDGYLTKVLTAFEEAHVISFYGKFHFVGDFSDK